MVHVIVDLGKVRGGKRLVETLDLARGSKGQSLGGILSVSDVRTDDSLGQEDRPEDGNLDVAADKGESTCIRAARD